MSYARDIDSEQLARREELRAKFYARARFDEDGMPVVYVAPHDHQAGSKPGIAPLKKGETAHGWRCWICGKVEHNEAWLAFHGLQSCYPQQWERKECAIQMLLRAHREWNERQPKPSEHSVRKSISVFREKRK